MSSLIDGLDDGDVAVVVGDLSQVTRHMSAQQRPWLTATLSNPDGSVAVQVPPKVYAGTAAPIVDHAPAVIRGRVDRRGGTPILVAIEVARPGGKLAVNRQARRANQTHPNRRLRRHHKGCPNGRGRNKHT